MSGAGQFGLMTAVLSAGVVIGYGLAWWKLSAEFEDRIAEETSAVADHYREKFYPPKDVDEDISHRDESPMTPSVGEKLVKVETRAPEDMVDYANIVTQYISRGDDDEEDDDVEYDDDDAGPYVDAEYEEGQPLYERVTHDVLMLNEYGYEAPIHFTYHIHEDLLVDFWGERIPDPEFYVGDLLVPQGDRSEEDKIFDPEYLCVVNHDQKILVEVTMDPRPVEETTYAKNEAYIKKRWSELKNAHENKSRKEGTFNDGSGE